MVFARAFISTKRGSVPEPVYFTVNDVTRMWSHGVEVSIAKDTGVYLICWDSTKNPNGPLDLACGYLEDGFYLDETVSPKTDSEKFAEIWEASRQAVGGDDFCDSLPAPSPQPSDATHLAILVKEDEIEMWWVGPKRP